MLALASNHLRSYLAPARREANPSPLGTAAIVGAVALGGYLVWRHVIRPEPPTELTLDVYNTLEPSDHAFADLDVGWMISGGTFFAKTRTQAPYRWTWNHEDGGSYDWSVDPNATSPPPPMARRSGSEATRAAAVQALRSALNEMGLLVAGD